MTAPDDPTDPLTVILTGGGLSRPDLESTLVRWIAHEFQNDQYAQLDAIGVPDDARVRLARVFVDLADETEVRSDDTTAFTTYPEEPPPPGVLSSLLARPTYDVDCLNAQVVTEESAPFANTGSHRTLIIGGPGQGKTTLVQYLCQIHRAAVLAHHRDALEDNQRITLTELLDRCTSDGLALPVEPCIPLLVVLRELSAWIVRNPTVAPADALLSHIATRGAPLPPTDLALLLARGRWLLVLDGLDEVPGAAGRDQTLAAIQAFIQRFAATIPQIVATTRPQSYGGEFDHFNRLCRLAPLSLHRALWYARTLVESWFPDAPTTGQRVLERLLLAAREDTTARLMQSPLQVTIMATLLHRLARAPHERWRLFKDYFNTIYDRELGRRSDAAEILRSHRPHIEAIHTQAALHLQVACETDPSAQLSRDALLTIVRARLATQYTDEARRKELASRILEVAETRLVFLVSLRPEHYGFELRSLQEFLAAEALMNSREHTADGAIRRIARTPHWRNVLLFAVSRCFSTSSPLIETFTTDLCAKLDDDTTDPTAAVLHPGAHLALDILEEGSALYYPAITLRLLARAMSRLEAVDVLRMRRVLTKLATEPDVASGTAQAVLHAITPHVMTRDDQSAVAWNLLNIACEISLTGAETLAAAAWAAAGEHKAASVRYLRTVLSPWFLQALHDDAPSFAPLLWQRLAQRAAKKSPLSTAFARGMRPMSIYAARGLAKAIYLRRLNPPPKSTPLQLPDTPGWQALARAIEFCENPSPLSLAAAIRAIRAANAARWHLWSATSWPLAATLAAAESDVELEQMASRSERGELGNLSDWLAAERRWSTSGVILTDFEAFAANGSAPTPQIAFAGFPFLEWRYLVSSDVDGPALTNLYRRASVRQAQRLFARLIIFHRAPIPHDLRPEIVQDATGQLSLSFIQYALTGLSDDEFFAHLDTLASRPDYQYTLGVDDERAAIRQLTQRISARLLAEPSRSGLRRLLTSLAIRFLSVPREIVDALATPAATDRVGREAELLWHLAHPLDNQVDQQKVARDLLGLADTPSNAFTFEFGILVRALSPEVAEGLLVSMLRMAAHSHPLRHLSKGLLVELRGKRRSGLHNPEVWRQLDLPDPPPPDPETPTVDADDDDATAYRLDSLRVTNIRAFERFELEAVPPDNGHGQWIVLVGENGVGKTSILRAITLALATRANAIHALKSLPAPLRRSADVRATIRLTSRGRSHEIAVTSDKDEEIIESGDTDVKRPFLLAAYGCRRGSAIGGPERALLTEARHDIHTLFDDTESGLNHAELWLQKLDHHALEEKTPGPAHQLRETVIEALKDILPGVESIEIDSREVCLIGPQIGRTRLAGLSDGYVTTLGWACDLMARWIHKMELRGRPIPANFPQSMTGLVLIDEIDLHLHPRWQLRVLEDIRRIFPKMSFIATTHNPLTLLGARPGELHVLRAGDRAGVVEALQLDIPPGLHANQVLTGVWFGVTSTVDPGTIQLMLELRNRIRSGANPGDPTVTQLEAELRKRLQLVPAALERVVDWGDQHAQRTPEQEAAVRQDMHAQLLRRKKRSP